VPFQIVIRTGSQLYRLDVVHIRGEKFELLKIYNPKTPENYIVLQSNRPFLRHILKLKYKAVDWQVKEGVIKNPRILEEAQRQIEAWLKSKGME
jgi:hypothetical protein